VVVRPSTYMPAEIRLTRACASRRAGRGASPARLLQGLAAGELGVEVDAIGVGDVEAGEPDGGDRVAEPGCDRERRGRWHAVDLEPCGVALVGGAEVVDPDDGRGREHGTGQFAGLEGGHGALRVGPHRRDGRREPGLGVGGQPVPHVQELAALGGIDAVAEGDDGGRLSDQPVHTATSGCARPLPITDPANLRPWWTSGRGPRVLPSSGDGCAGGAVVPDRGGQREKALPHPCGDPSMLRLPYSSRSSWSLRVSVTDSISWPISGTAGVVAALARGRRRRGVGRAGGG
jgi:hypothetical protein